MLVAAGPFCVVDNLEFDPLEDFGDVVIEKKPDVVLLIGPFVDTSNTKIQLGDINLDDGLIDGKEAWGDDQFSESLGKQKMGSLLKPKKVA